MWWPSKEVKCELCQAHGGCSRTLASARPPPHGTKAPRHQEHAQLLTLPSNKLSTVNTIASLAVPVPCTSLSRSDPARFEEATHRTTRWIDRCIAAHSRPTEQNLFAIVQGGLDPRLREISMQVGRGGGRARGRDAQVQRGGRQGEGSVAVGFRLGTGRTEHAHAHAGNVNLCLPRRTPLQLHDAARGPRRCLLSHQANMSPLPKPRRYPPLSSTRHKSPPPNRHRPVHC